MKSVLLVNGFRPTQLKLILKSDAGNIPIATYSTFVQTFYDCRVR